MPNGYSYIDLDYAYTDPKTGVLRNLAGVNDHDTLVFIESGAVAKRMAELKIKPLKIKNADTLLAIHKHLFQDVYDWAGKIRTVDQQGWQGVLSIEPFPQRFLTHRHDDRGLPWDRQER